ncbi:MAG: hypothetical protein ACXVGB_03235 [Mycobacteriaceae bacterium]
MVSEDGRFTGDDDPAAVDAAVAALVEAGLLVPTVGISRRVLLQRAGVVAAAAGIMTIGLPTAANAASTPTVVIFTLPGVHILTVPVNTTVSYTVVGGGGGAPLGAGGAGGTVLAGGAGGGGGGGFGITGGGVSTNTVTTNGAAPTVPGNPGQGGAAEGDGTNGYASFSGIGITGT